MMNQETKQAAEISRACFAKFGAPVIKTLYPDAKIIPVEGEDNPLAKMLDVAGIDYVVDCRDGIFGIASRCQHGENFATFTIRASRPNGTKTEFDKISEAREKRHLMPTLHVQTYVLGDNIASVGVAETIKLVYYVENNKPTAKETASGEKFYVLPWKNLRRVGDKIRTFVVTGDGNVQEI